MMCKNIHCCPVSSVWRHVPGAHGSCDPCSRWTWHKLGHIMRLWRFFGSTTFLSGSAVLASFLKIYCGPIWRNVHFPVPLDYRSSFASKIDARNVKKAHSIIQFVMPENTLIAVNHRVGGAKTYRCCWCADTCLTKPQHTYCRHNTVTTRTRLNTTWQPVKW